MSAILTADDPGPYPVGERSASALLRALFPAGVAVVETWRPSPWETEPLFAVEAAGLSAGALERRQREFALGRACARRALAALGRPAVTVPVGARREPLWPPGVVGSLTHCATYGAAAVSDSASILALGIDAEVHAPLSERVIAKICTASERHWLRDAPATGIHWPTLIFSAKESVYKAWFPVTRQWLGFLDVDLDLDPEGGTFQARLTVPDTAASAGFPASVTGRFVCLEDLILTAVVVPATGQHG